MTEPQVTVLICTFNDEQTIAYALGSALAQTAAPSSFRILVVNDGSTDATPRVLEAFRERVEVVNLDRNHGLTAACNVGLERIRTPWFVRLDADDRFEPELVSALLRRRDGSDAELIATDRWEQIRTGGFRRFELDDPPRIGQLIAAGTLLPTGLVRRLGGYRDLFWEEFDLYMRLLDGGRRKAARVPQPLYVYRVERPDQMTADTDAVRAGWRQLRELWPHDVLSSHALVGAEEVPDFVA